MHTPPSLYLTPGWKFPITDAKNLHLIFDYQMPHALAEAIDQAHSDILIVQYQFRVAHHPYKEMRLLLHALKDAADRSTTIRILLNHPTAENQTRQDHGTLFAELKHAYIRIRHHPTDRILHSKFIVLDDQTIIIGSHNFSQPSFATSRNLSVQIESKHLVARVRSVYDDLWDRATDATR